jgi:hypothetical protein
LQIGDDSSFLLSKSFQNAHSDITSDLVAEEVIDSMLDMPDGGNGETIWSALKPFAEVVGPFKSNCAA